MADKIIVKGAKENNLKNVDVEIPHNKLTVVTGVSGSGKSSLVFDTIYREGQRRFLESFSGYSRHFIGKTYKPEANEISGIFPAIAIDQKSMVRSPKSTVGTISGIYDYLRLLFARLGKTDKPLGVKINRSLFSFNSPSGFCPACKGLGVTDRIAQRFIVGDENKTLREGALVLTTPNGYIIYSQVTMDVMNQVCNSEGFSVDIPWKDLTDEQKHIVMYGSNKIKIPFGKHTLESRMKWSGITAKPREEGYYKGIVPVMEEILKRDRNPNILKFAETVSCESCNGTRLRAEALQVKISNYNIAELSILPIEELHSILKNLSFSPQDNNVATPILNEIFRLSSLFKKLRLDYLSLSRESSSLSGGELQRLKLLGLIGSGISNTLYIFDEPGAGLHPSDNENLIQVMESLIDEGNTIIAVEHDEATMHNADYIVDVGPEAGKNGGEILYHGDFKGFLNAETNSITKEYLLKEKEISFDFPNAENGSIEFIGCSKNNLQSIDVKIKLNQLNVVSGVSGAGKSSLVKGVIHENLIKKLKGEKELAHLKEIKGWEQIKKVLEVDQSPIGKTLRSNPATYIGLFDKIRDLFAKQPEAKERQWKKGRFSFNTKGGRCEECEGAGIKNIGMHFLGNVNAPCEACNGKRFNAETLEVAYQGKDISEVLELSINQAQEFFSNEKDILHYLTTLQELGLGYLKLGQPSNTLSGGEAQRLKLAEELVKQAKQPTLYIFDEPTVGLHFHDINNLLRVFERILKAGHTILIIEHDPSIISLANHLIDLGPESGSKGGSLVFMGHPKEIQQFEDSITSKYLNNTYQFNKTKSVASSRTNQFDFKDISTHNLKHVDLSIPKNQLVTFAGVSGSGKSSLVYDTIYAEAANRYSLNLSAYIRSFLPKTGKGNFETLNGLTPTIAINKKRPPKNPRSIVATFTGIHDYLRILYTRFGEDKRKDKQVKLNMSSLSFNHESGACEACKGLGKNLVCDPDKLVSNPKKSLSDGALNGTKTGKFYGDPFGQYIATLIHVGKLKGIDFSKPYNELSEEEQNIAMYGCDNEEFEVQWKFKRNNREGMHEFKGKWPGFTVHVNDEFLRKHQDKRGEEMLPLMKEEICSSCNGNRIKQENQAIYFEQLPFAESMKLSIEECHTFFSIQTEKKSMSIIQPIVRKLDAMIQLGLGYISLDREVSTLSSGEWQRLKIATHIYEGLTGVTYILDEPSTGLHPKNIEKLSEILQLLKEQGNSIFLVEHHPEIIKKSDQVIELGPEAGIQGGEIVYQGKPSEIHNSRKSILKDYLTKNWEYKGSTSSSNKILEIKGAFAHNLKNIDVEFYEGCLNVITGVSGSGKSTLLHDVIYETLLNKKATGCKGFKLLKEQQTILISDTQVHESKLSTPITYTNIHQDIFKELAKNNDQKEKLKPNLFSFNAKDGQCHNCKGQGKIKIPMDFVADVWLSCEVCNGKRYNDEALKFSYQQKNISEIVEMTFEEAIQLFKERKQLTSKLSLFKELGLGYLKLSQDFTSISSGELQRIKLIKAMLELNEPAIVLMDEPTSGLHFKDIERLMQTIQKLIDKQFTIIAIEHNQQFISHAMHKIELGSGGGKFGGKII